MAVTSLLPIISSHSCLPTREECRQKRPAHESAIVPAQKNDYTRWRPQFHLMSPRGWMNDPCAPGFNPASGEYYVSFQSNLNLSDNDWTQMCWRTAVSQDMLSWNIDENPSLSPDRPYDCKGVFTGCMMPQRQDGLLAYAYTSVSHLPIHYSLPHPRHSESLSLAVSRDGGKSWEKSVANPILSGQPEGIDVTGWRDPFVSKWPHMCEVVGLPKEQTLFGIISGGIRNVTPTTFLYAIDARDPEKWSYIGPLVNLGLNKRVSRWSGDLGVNWEVTNFCTIMPPDGCPPLDFLIMGTEGCLSNDKTTSILDPSRPARQQLWMSGTLSVRKAHDSVNTGPVTMEYEFGGHLDHGCLYAANSFYDPRSRQRIVWGWIGEDDLCNDLRHRQGWSGLLSLPRALEVQVIRHAIRAWNSPLESITSLRKTIDHSGSYTLHTLTNNPIQTVADALRSNSRRVAYARLAAGLQSLSNRDLSFTADDIRTLQWWLECSFRVTTRCKAIGVQIIHSRDFSQSTTLMWLPFQETFTIHRPSRSQFLSENASVNDGALVNSSPEQAPHTLFVCRDPTTGEEYTEDLHISAWRDNSVLEVFVNKRTAISTRLYAADETIGIRFFADDVDWRDLTFADHSTHTNGPSQLLYATLYDGMKTHR